MINIDPIAVSEYEKAAVANPKAYRRRVAITAILGDSALMGMQLLPLALFLGVPLLFYPHPFLFWTTGIAFVFFVWLLRPTFRIGGRELLRSEAPMLFGELDQLRAKLSVQGKMRVFLDDQFNASAGEGRGLFGLFGTTRVLTLGVPLLASLSREQVLAVIAHEFGHFSRRHGRLGHWIYRARAGWLSYAEIHDDEDGLYERAMSWYSHAFVPRFAAMSFVYSRRCEYEADADSASVVGAGTLGDALTRIHVQSKFWSSGVDEYVSSWCKGDARTPGDFYQRAVDTLGIWEHEKGTAALEAAMAEQSSHQDTHPCLSERLAALGATPALGPAATVSGATLLGQAWESICAEFNLKWQESNSVDWAARHFHFNIVAAKLVEKDDEDALRLPAGDQLARALALRSAAPDRAKGLIKALHARFPDDDQVAFHLGSILLDETPAAGSQMLAELWERATVFRKRTAGILAEHYSHSSDQVLAGEWKSKLAANLKSRARIADRILESVDAGRATTAILEQPGHDYFMSVLQFDRTVSSAWLFHSQEMLLSSRNDERNRLDVYVLWLVLDTGMLNQQGVDEDAVASRLAKALRLIVRPCDEIITKTSLTTEIAPSWLEQKSKFFARG
jgi:Zn-dependent protease with chaperone function